MAKSPYPWLDDVLNLMARRSPPESGIKPVAWYFEKQDDWRELNKQTWREHEPGAWYLKKQVWRKRAAARVLFSNRPGWEAKFFGSLKEGGDASDPIDEIYFRFPRMPGYEANTINTDLAAAAARKDHAFFKSASQEEHQKWWNVCVVPLGDQLNRLAGQKAGVPSESSGDGIASNAGQKANDAAAALSDDEIKQLILAEAEKVGRRPPIRWWKQCSEMRQRGVTRSRFELLWHKIYQGPKRGRPQKT